MWNVRSAAITTAILFTLLHVVVLLGWYGTPAASLWGDWIDTATPLAAAIVCWLISRQAGPFGKRVWRLVGFSGLLAAIGQGLYTDYYDYRHSALGTLWPSDVLVFFWVVPAMMTLFLNRRDQDKGYEWLRVCDFAQVCALVLALELSQIYVPSQWQSAGRSMEERAFHAGIFFFGALALSFLPRGVLAADRTAKSFYLRLGAFLAVHGTVLNSTLKMQASGNYQQGTWTDLPWTISFCLLVVLAGTWKDSETKMEIERPSRALEMLAYFSPLLIPAIVFSLVLRIAQEQFLWSVVLVTISFAAASGRLFVSQHQLLISSREIEKNLALLQGITEGTTDAIFVKDLEGRYLMVNSAAAKFSGLPSEQVLGKNDSELFAESGRKIMEFDRKVLAEGITQTFEERITANNESRIFLSTKGPFHDQQGKTIGILGVARDVTAQKQAEEAIRQSQEKLRIHFEHTPLAVIEWDLDFRVTEWNPAAERMFGYSRQEALGQHGHFIVPPAIRDLVDKVWLELIHRKPADSAIRGYKFRNNDNVTKDGRLISCEWYNTPLADESGRVLGVASLAQNVTERAALEEKLRHSQKMEAIGRLAGGVAHDFNNLLTVILGYTQVVADGLNAGSKLANSTGQIKAAAERAAGITRQLLAFSRKQVLSPRVINLNDIMLNLDSLLRRLIGEDIEVLTIPDEKLGSVKADPGQIEQVIMNLALNSRDAMPGGGKLTLETANADLDEAYARDHQFLEPGRYVMLAVSDTGEGMTEETQAQIFEPFYTTKEVGKGTGLGLSMVYGIVNQSGGHIWVYSEPGKGTTFKIYLPRVDQPVEAAPIETHPRVRKGTETILLVEDEPQLRDLSSTVLSQSGYKVLVAGTPEEGLAICHANHNEIRLLVTDVVMPRMNGRQLAESITKVCPKAKVLYISGYTDNAVVHYGVLDPGLWFLAKPFTLSALVAKVREVLDAEGAPA